MNNKSDGKPAKVRRASNVDVGSAEQVEQEGGDADRKVGAPSKGVEGDVPESEPSVPGGSDDHESVPGTSGSMPVDPETGSEPDPIDAEVVEGKADDVILPAARRGRGARTAGTGAGRVEAHPGAPADRESSDVAERLVSLKDLILSDVTRLAHLLADAVARKVRIGRHLAQAQECCLSAKVSWTGFLKGCGISDRTAREAIAFHRNEGVIEEMRHGRAALTVMDVRLATAKSRTVEGGSQGRRQGGDEPTGGSVPAGPRSGRGGPPIGPSIRNPLHLGGPSDVAPDAERVLEGRRHSVVLDEPGQGAPPASIAASQSLADDGPRSDESVEYFEAFEARADAMIDGLSAGANGSSVGRLLRAMPIIQAAVHRLDSALKALDGAEGRGQPA
jgi:hypothetical protein